AAEGNLPRPLADGLLAQGGLQGGGAGSPGGHPVDGDAVATEFHRRPPHQGVDGPLGGAVVADAVEVVAIGGQRRGEQDAPGGALAEVGVGVLHQPEARIDADVEDFLKFAVVGGQQRGIGQVCGVVDQDVEPTPQLDGTLHQGPGGGPLPQLHRDQLRLATLPANVRHRALAVAGGAGGDQYPGAVAGEQPGDGPADALAGARDDGPAPVETAGGGSAGRSGVRDVGVSAVRLSL